MWKARALVLIASLSGCDPQPGIEPPATSAAPSAPSTSASAAPLSSSTAAAADLTAERDRFAKELAAVVEQAKKAPKKLVRCPAEMTRSKGDAQVVHAYSLGFADKVANGKAMSVEQSAMTAFRPPFHQLLVGGIVSAVADRDATHLRRIFDRPHVAIVSVDKLEMPSIADDASFLTGTFRGWVHVFDLATGKTMCGAPLEFMSSEKVEFSESLSAEQAARRFDIEKSDAKFHIRVDFFMQGHAALREAMRKMSEALSVEVRTNP